MELVSWLEAPIPRTLDTSNSRWRFTSSIEVDPCVISHKNPVIFALNIKGNHLYDCLVCYLYFCFFFGGAVYRSCQYGSIVMWLTRNVFKSTGLTLTFGTFGFLFVSFVIHLTVHFIVHLNCYPLSLLPRSQSPCEHHIHRPGVYCRLSQISSYSP